MKKKGFTLIELLAVIVVLAIIALIATPIVMNTIKNSKKGAAERTADNYVGQVETSLMTYRINNNESFPDGTYSIDTNGNLTGNEKTLTIEMNGTKPSSGIIVIENGGVKKDGTTMKVGDYDVTYDTDNKTFVASESAGSNVEVLCKANTTKVSALVWGGSDYPLSSDSYNSEEVGLLASESGKYTPGVTYTCNLGDGDRTFYVLEESGDNVSLILGTNLGNTVEWGPSHDDDMNELGNVLGPVYALKHLQEQTTNWNNLEESQISLPTKDQIYKAAGNKTSGLPIWLYSYTNTNVSFGYWTATPDDSDFLGAWHITCSGSIGNHQIDFTSIDVGIRPVITISKTQLG